METQRLRECLDADFRRMREAAAGADLAAPVPSCPGWTTADLVRHIGEVYLHKVECMRLGRGPEPWPPASLRGEPSLELLDRGYAALVAEFAARRPEEHAFTWYDPDQTVGFWIRRMAQETVIHRVDAELAAGVQVAAVADDLAADGIDEVLVVFMEFATAGWPEEFAETLASAEDRTVALVTAPALVAGAADRQGRAGGRVRGGRPQRDGGGACAGRAALAVEPRRGRRRDDRRPGRGRLAAPGSGGLHPVASARREHVNVAGDSKGPILLPGRQPCVSLRGTPCRRENWLMVAPVTSSLTWRG